MNTSRTEEVAPGCITGRPWTLLPGVRRRRTDGGRRAGGRADAVHRKGHRRLVHGVVVSVLGEVGAGSTHRWAVEHYRPDLLGRHLGTGTSGALPGVAPADADTRRRRDAGPHGGRSCVSTLRGAGPHGGRSCAPVLPSDRDAHSSPRDTDAAADTSPPAWLDPSARCSEAWASSRPRRSTPALSSRPRATRAAAATPRRSR